MCLTETTPAYCSAMTSGLFGTVSRSAIQLKSSATPKAWYKYFSLPKAIHELHSQSPSGGSIVMVSGGFQCVSHVAPSTTLDDGSIAAHQKAGAASRSRQQTPPARPEKLRPLWKEVLVEYTIYCATDFTNSWRTVWTCQQILRCTKMSYCHLECDISKLAHNSAGLATPGNCHSSPVKYSCGVLEHQLSLSCRGLARKLRLVLSACCTWNTPVLGVIYLFGNTSKIEIRSLVEGFFFDIEGCDPCNRVLQ